MADFRTRLTLPVTSEIRGYFKDKAFNTVLPRNIRLAEAPSFGSPIHMYDASCVGAKAYKTLTEEILKEKINIDPNWKNRMNPLSEMTEDSQVSSTELDKAIN